MTDLRTFDGGAMTNQQVRERLRTGLVIPACPLPLSPDRVWSERHQRALVRYYAAAGAGGVAVGVHSTQFEIRRPEVGLFRPVLALVADELAALQVPHLVRIAGVCGDTRQAMDEVGTALELGYHAALVSLKEWGDRDEEAVLEHCRRVAGRIPLFGFYLQPAVGGRVLSYSFWRRFVEIPNVVGIKVAPFNRYQTLDVVRAVVESGRDEVALYTGNDDNIINDLMTPFSFPVHGEVRTRFFDGGLLGQWGIWTQAAVRMLEDIKRDRAQPAAAPRWLAANAALTDANAAVFDAAHLFAGCIPGILEMLRRVGLSPSHACLDPRETLSPGQDAELDRVTKAYPRLMDDDFVARHRDRWLGG